MKKNFCILLAMIAALALAFVGLNAVLTSGYSVQTESISFVTDEGVTLEGTLFVPSNATAENPAAGVLVCPGGNTPGAFYGSYEIELSRRGYVVFSYDYYGTKGSGMTTEGSSGAIAAMKYLTSLSFVDSNRLAATGHSNGGAQAFAAITSEYASSAAHRSVLFIGCGLSSTELSDFDNLNVGAIWGQLDEAGQGVFWDSYDDGTLNYGDMATLTGTTNETIVPGQLYGDPADNSARIVYTPNTFHSLSNIMPSAVTNIISFINTTLAGNTINLADNNFIYIWQEWLVLIIAVLLCAMIFPMGSILIEAPFFQSLKQPVPEAKSKGNIKFWVFLLIPAIICALLVKDTIIQGQTIMGNLPKLFNVQSTDGFIWWFFLSAIVTVVVFIIRSFVDKTVDRKAFLSKFRTTPVNLGKAILFGLGVVAVPYLCAVIGERTVGWYGRIFQTYFNAIDSSRLYEFPVYFILFAILFLVYAAIQSDGLRLENDRKGIKSYLVTLLANALPALLFLVYIYGTLVITHVTPINGREMSRANGAMLGMLLLYFVIAKVVTHFTKKSGNIYVIACVNSAFVTWVSINVQQFIV